MSGKCGPTSKRSAEKQTARSQSWRSETIPVEPLVYLISAVCLCLHVFLLLAAGMCIAFVQEQIFILLSHCPSSCCCSTEYVGPGWGESIPPYQIAYIEEMFRGSKLLVPSQVLGKNSNKLRAFCLCVYHSLYSSHNYSEIFLIEQIMKEILCLKSLESYYNIIKWVMLYHFQKVLAQ